MPHRAPLFALLLLCPLAAAGAPDAGTQAGPAPAPAPSAPQGFDLTAFHRRIAPSVVLLSVRDALGEERSLGTGFFVTPEGLIATNVHVIDDAPAMVAVTSDGRELEVLGWVGKDPDHDVALVQVAGAGHPALELGGIAEAVEGQPIITLGNPAGFSFTLATGIVSSVRLDGVPEEIAGPWVPKGALLQFTAPSTGGSSGSPLLNREGRVLGVVQGTLGSQGSLHFAVPADWVRKLLDAAGPQPKVTAFGGTPWRNLGISAGVFALIGAWFWARQPRRKKRAPELN